MIPWDNLGCGPGLCGLASGYVLLGADSGHGLLGLVCGPGTLGLGLQRLTARPLDRDYEFPK